MKINHYEFNWENMNKIRLSKHGENWPVVYIIHNDKEAYIGESANFLRRFQEHMNNENRNSLTEIKLIDDDKFNKSAVLDIESELIRLMDADEKFKLQNIVLGQNQAHDYYEREIYRKMIGNIWNNLFQMDLAKHEYLDVKNSELFLYSPYKTLTSDQYEAVKDVLFELGQALLNKKSSRMAVHGGAGTGKSILAVYLMKVLMEIKSKEIEMSELDQLQGEGKYEEGLIDGLLKAFNQMDYKIGMVIPVKSFRKTMGKVFHKVKGLQSKLLLTPSDVVNAYLKGEPYDILLIDEAQRLKRPQNVQNLKNFYIKNEALGIDKYCTELDWLLKCSTHQIFFYDNFQKVSGSDIQTNELDKLCYTNEFNLNTQLRVEGGNEFIKYIRDVFRNKPPETKLNLKDYDVKLYDDVKKMTDDIKIKNEEFGLCRNIAGFAWPWNTKDKKKHLEYDIEIEGNKFIWNNDNNAWITHPNSINEIGSIHTMQGQELNYTGLIIGNELSYDFESNEIIICKDNFYDKNAKVGLSNNEIRDNILNAYYVLISRARRGVYIYVCDPNFKRYMQQFF